MYRISKQFGFSASHVLHGLRPGHACGRLHGHNYLIQAELAAGELDPVGFVADYGDLAPFGRWLDTTFDHRHLNDVMEANPTAEHLAHMCAARLIRMFESERARVSAVGVSETPKTWAWYHPPQ
jgi:6-pyruvoyltetrahydropterin/6-carboxytetrahydropterin synthase